MSSKEILGNYLDKDLFDAVGEKTIEKVIQSNSNLSGPEVKILALILQRRHDMTSMERVRDDISNLDLVHTTESEYESQSDISDDSVLNLIRRLNELNENIDSTITNLKDERERVSNHIEKLMENIALETDMIDYASIVEEIHNNIRRSI